MEAVKTAVLVCPGPSCNPTVALGLGTRGDIFTVNRAAFLYSQPVAGEFYADGLSYYNERDRLRISQSQSRKIVRTKAEGWEGCEFFPYSATIPGLRFDPFARGEREGVYRGPLLTTLMAFLYLGAIAGYKRIEIYGCDCSVKRGRYYYDCPTPEPKLRFAESRYRIVRQQLSIWLPYAQRRGITTVNLSAESLLRKIMTTEAL